MRKFAPVAGLGFFLAAVLGAIFAPYFYNYFVADDFFHLAFARFSAAPGQVWWKPFYAKVFWRPLTLSLEVLLYHRVGLSPLGNHLADAVLHGINAGLVSLLVWVLSRPWIAERFWRWAGAYLAGALFAVHPIGLLTASWICCRADLLGTGFVLLSLILFLQFRGRPFFTGLACLSALLAALSKETMIVLPGLILAAAWLFPSGRLAGRPRSAIRETLPFVATLGLYLAWRLWVLGAMGGYEPLRFRLSFFLPRLAYHLPLILQRASRDLLFHHLDPQAIPFRLLALFFVLLLLGTGWQILRRQPRLLGFALAWIALTLAPLWNVSQMLVRREERLLYLPLVGLTLLAPAGLAGFKRSSTRGLALCLWILVLYSYGLASIPTLRSWQKAGKMNQALALALRQKVTEIQPPPSAARFYVLGLDPDQYYLDPMLKLELPLPYLGNRFMLGDHPSLVWEFIPALSSPAPSEPRPPAEALPSEEIFPIDPQNRLAAVTPPNLLLALQQDAQARALEWKGELILETSQELRALNYKLGSMQELYSERRRFLPTWSFYRGRLPLAWSLSPDCVRDDSDLSEDALAFAAAGPDPYLLSPSVRFHAAGAKAVEIELKLPRLNYLPPDRSEAGFFWTTQENPDWGGSREIRFPLQADGRFHTYRLELDSNLAWVKSGLVRQVRLDPISGPGRFWLRRIVFFSRAEIEEPEK